MADVTVGGSRVTHKSNLLGACASRPASHARPASVRRNNSTEVATSGSTALRSINSPKWRASTVSGDGLPRTEPSGESGRWPGTRGSRTRSAGSSRRPSHPTDARCALTMLGGAAISTSTSSISRKPSSPGIASAPHGTRASRALGEMNNATRGDATQSVSSCHACAAIRRDPRSLAIASSADGEANGPAGIALSTASRCVSEPFGSGNAAASWSSAAIRLASSTTQVTVRAGSPTTRRLA